MAASTAPGPLERTVVEIATIERGARFQRRRIAPARAALRDSDTLMSLVEEYVENDNRLVPIWLWGAVARVVATVDADLRDDLGIDRRPGHVAEILFGAQRGLMQAAHQESQPQLAPIIPLFPS